MKLGVVSLGCDKATVDSERLVGELVGHGAVVTPDLRRAARALPQDLRRLRSHVRFLRDPVDAGEASLGAARAAGARGADARSAGRAGDQPGGPGPGALRP